MVFIIFPIRYQLYSHRRSSFSISCWLFKYAGDIVVFHRYMSHIFLCATGSVLLAGWQYFVRFVSFVSRHSYPCSSFSFFVYIISSMHRDANCCILRSAVSFVLSVVKPYFIILPIAEYHRWNLFFILMRLSRKTLCFIISHVALALLSLA